MFIDNACQTKVKRALLEKYGQGNAFRIEHGVAQAAGLWTEADGSPEEFEKFCLEQFIGDESLCAETFERLDRTFESIEGHFSVMLVQLQEKLHLDIGEIRPLDMLLGQFDPSSHLADDLFQNKLAFIVLLNFPRYTLKEKQEQGAGWSLRQWAMARLGDSFRSRVPAEISQEISRVAADADAYISEYNIYLDQLRDNSNRSLFPKGLKLISHWGLRDELKSHYGQPDGQAKQDIIHQVMKRIITQDVPENVVNNPEWEWNPYDNTTSRNGKKESCPAEPNKRYQHVIEAFHVMQRVDAYFPAYPTFPKRKFDLERELTEDEITKLFDDCLSSPLRKKVADKIRKQLGRNLCPYDIWYNGFGSKPSIATEKLDKIVGEKYPTIEAFQANLPQILVKLGFTAKQAEDIVSGIIVEPSRGAGHAWMGVMKSGLSRLRTRFGKNGMDYKGYNIAIHEFGHTVEQVISTRKVDYHLVHGVPCSAFSEAFAFVFQERNLELLGVAEHNPQASQLKTLDLYWAACEIMGVALLDIRMWNWLYQHPQASAAALKQAMIETAKQVWNQYFAETFGLRDEIILAIYSHIISYPLYLAEYPLGHLIQFQLEKHLEGKNLGSEMERICSIGSIIPQLWMKKAVGAEISVQPMLKAVEKALATIA